MTSKEPRVSALALAEPAPAARRIDRDAVERAARDLLRGLGADVDAGGLEETPRRVADAYTELLTPQPFSSHHLPQRPGLRRADRRPVDPLPLAVHAPPVPFPGRGARR